MFETEVKEEDIQYEDWGHDYKPPSDRLHLITEGACHERDEVLRDDLCKHHDDHDKHNVAVYFPYQKQNERDQRNHRIQLKRKIKRV